MTAFFVAPFLKEGFYQSEKSHYQTEKSSPRGALDQKIIAAQPR